MEDWLTRERALIGNSATERIISSSVLVFGLGGVGGAVCEALARAGIGRFTLVDNDTVSLSNINRQFIATQNTVGKYKTDLMRDRILSINPNAEIQCVCAYADESNISEIIENSSCDWIVDAIDSVKSKLAIAVYAKEHNINIISSMGTGNRITSEGFKVCDISKTSVCPLAKVMRIRLKKLGITHLDVLFSDALTYGNGIEDESGKRVPASISFVPPVAGFKIAEHIITRIISKASE